MSQSGLFGVDVKDYFSEVVEPNFTLLMQHQSVQNIFNYCVTAYHVLEYISRSSAPRGDIEDIRQTISEIQRRYPFNILGYACNKIKHWIRDRGEVNDQTASSFSYSGCVGGAPLNELPINGGDRFLIEYEGRHYDVVDIAQAAHKELPSIIENYGV